MIYFPDIFPSHESLPNANLIDQIYQIGNQIGQNRPKVRDPAPGPIEGSAFPLLFLPLARLCRSRVEGWRAVVGSDCLLG